MVPLTETQRSSAGHRTKGQVEADISKGIVRFKREHMGRGPADIRTRVVQDMVIVRMGDMLTPAEHGLVRSGGGQLLKQVRMTLLESTRAELYRIIQEATGCEVATMYSDLCPETGERLIVFALRENLETWLH